MFNTEVKYYLFYVTSSLSLHHFPCIIHLGVNSSAISDLGSSLGLKEKKNPQIKCSHICLISKVKF